MYILSGFPNRVRTRFIARSIGICHASIMLAKRCLSLEPRRWGFPEILGGTFLGGVPILKPWCLSWGTSILGKLPGALEVCPASIGHLGFDRKRRLQPIGFWGFRGLGFRGFRVWGVKALVFEGVRVLGV